MLIQKFKIEETIGVSGAIDHDLGVVRNVKLARVCTANGVDFTQDIIKRMFEVSKGKDVPAHFGHTYNPNYDELETYIGVFKDVRLDGDVLRGDLYLSESAKFGRDNTDYFNKVLSLCENDANNCGISPVVIYSIGDDDSFNVEDVIAFDFVQYPAFRQGLFSESLNTVMNEETPIQEPTPESTPDLASEELTAIIDKIAEIDKAIKAGEPTTELAKSLMDLLAPLMSEEAKEEAVDAVTETIAATPNIQEYKEHLDNLRADLEALKANYSELAGKINTHEQKFSEASKIKMNPIYSHVDDESGSKVSKVVSRRIY